MNAPLSITILQMPIVWNQPKSNIEYIEKQLAKINATDIVILPEAFTTGFSVSNFEAEDMQGSSVAWMQRMSKLYGIGIIGSIFIKESGKSYNRLVFTTPKSSIQYYDKWHLFSLGDEGKLLTRGDKLPLFTFKNWKIKPLICYDLRFPVTIRNHNNYDVIICVANWPKPRINAWDTLLKARAIENLSYVVGVNRVGVDGNGYEYIGHSNVYNPTGEALLNIKNDEFIETLTLHKSVIKNTRTTFPFLEDQDFFEIK